MRERASYRKGRWVFALKQIKGKYRERRKVYRKEEGRMFI